MRTSKIFLVSLILMITCGPVQGQEEEVSEIIYRTMTRGSQKTVTIKADAVSVEFRGIENSKKQLALTAEKWQELLQLCKTIELNALESMYGSTENQSSDRGAAAELILITNKGEYHSPLFDEGNPPDKLVKLVGHMSSYLKD